MKPSDQLHVDTGTTQQPYPSPLELSGEEASRIIYKPRETAVERLIDGKFFLRHVDFTRPEGVRAELERATDGYAFRADIPLGVLGHDQIEALKDNSWGRTHVAMSILVKELHNSYTSAKVISVKDIESDSE